MAAGWQLSTRRNLFRLLGNFGRVNNVVNTVLGELIFIISYALIFISVFFFVDFSFFIFYFLYNRDFLKCYYSLFLDFTVDFFCFIFSHLSFSTTLQFVLHNSVGWGCVCVLVWFFVKCVRMLQNIRMKVSLTNPIPKWRGENNTYTLSRNVKKSKFVFVCDFTLQCDISTKQTDVFLSIFLLLSKIAFRVLPRDQNFFYITFFVVNATVVLFLFFASCVFVFV